MHSNIPHISQIASDQIKSEIDRFESVHPCIYTIYDIVENGIQDIRLKELLRGQIINVEGYAFSNFYDQFLFLEAFVNRLKLPLYWCFLKD
jgi:hypothetical protein